MAIPQRRGRPPKTATTTSASDNPEPQETKVAGKRRRRGGVGGHQLKLGGVPVREGFVRRWVNDDANRLADVEELAYTPVEDRRIQSSDTGSRISRLVGTKATGQPLRAYLMETPADEYRVGVDEREENHRQIEAAIIAGRDSTDKLENQYGHGEIKTGPR